MKTRSYRTIKGAERTAIRLRAAFPGIIFTVVPGYNWDYVIRATDDGDHVSFVGVGKIRRIP